MLLQKKKQKNFFGNKNHNEKTYFDFLPDPYFFDFGGCTFFENAQKSVPTITPILFVTNSYGPYPFPAQGLKAAIAALRKKIFSTCVTLSPNFL